MIKQSWYHFYWCIQNTKSRENNVHPLCLITLSVPSWVFVRVNLLQNPKPENPGKLLWDSPSILKILIEKLSIFSGQTEQNKKHVSENIERAKCWSQFLRRPDLQENIFEVLHSSITLDKSDLECAGTVKAKPTGNYLGFINYSNTINVASKLLDIKSYIIT